MDNKVRERAAILRHFGAPPSVVDELLVYGSSFFQREPLTTVKHFPLADEEFVLDWEQYVLKLHSGMQFEQLAQWLVQLSFPIQPGISKTTEYLAATRQGLDTRSMASAVGIRLERSPDIRVFIHPTWAGRIPVIAAPCREDFVSLVRALSARNEPVEVPDSMGACMVSGYNNIGRLKRFRGDWRRAHHEALSLQAAEQHKRMYQDRFLILSMGAYSSVPAGLVGVRAEDWPGLSLIIRREHECAHYFTRRVLGSMRNHVLDEMIADYCGTLAATGTFRAHWLLAFLGLDRYPEMREKGRLHNYRGSPALGDEAFAIVQKLVMATVAHLEAFHRTHQAILETNQGSLLVLLTLTRFTLEELASDGAQQLLSMELQQRTRELPNYLEKGVGLLTGSYLENSHA